MLTCANSSQHTINLLSTPLTVRSLLLLPLRTSDTVPCNSGLNIVNRVYNTVNIVHWIMMMVMVCHDVMRQKLKAGWRPAWPNTQYQS